MGGGSGGGRGVPMAPGSFKANPSFVKYRAYSEGDDPAVGERVSTIETSSLLGTLLDFTSARSTTTGPTRGSRARPPVSYTRAQPRFLAQHNLPRDTFLCIS